VISRKNILAWLLSAAVYGACMFCLGLVMGRGMIGIAGGDSGVEKTLGEMRQSGRQLQTDMERRIREEYPRDTLRRLQEPSDSPHQRQSATEGRVSDGGGPSLNLEAYDDRFAGDIVERDTVIIKTPKTTKYEQAHPLVE
jgi:hypothetical protein